MVPALKLGEELEGAALAVAVAVADVVTMTVVVAEFEKVISTHEDLLYRQSTHGHVYLCQLNICRIVAAPLHYQQISEHLRANKIPISDSSKDTDSENICSSIGWPSYSCIILRLQE
jgi:hypothetical protein